VITAGGSQIMPYYGMPVGTELEPVAFGFNRGVVTGLLRERFGFDGIVCTDWGLINDAELLGQPMPARAWGVEHLSPLDRVAMVLEAGCDQFGGEACPELVVELVRTGRISRTESTSRYGDCCWRSSGSVCSTSATSTPTLPRRLSAEPTSSRLVWTRNVRRTPS
jgi:beta-glucosidase-like glycosyl hydrolase